MKLFRTPYGLGAKLWSSAKKLLRSLVPGQHEVFVNRAECGCNCCEEKMQTSFESSRWGYESMTPGEISLLLATAWISSIGLFGNLVLAAPNYIEQHLASHPICWQPSRLYRSQNPLLQQWLKCTWPRPSTKIGLVWKLESWKVPCLVLNVNWKSIIFLK